MKLRHAFLAAFATLLSLSVSQSNAQTLDYSFVVVGCNRVDYLDTAATTGTANATGVSTANVYQLRRLFTEVNNLNPKPKYLFLTGDVVMGYTNDTAALTRQLRAWKQIYYSHPIASSGIKVVVIPGNHETQDKAAGKQSYKGAEMGFIREMSAFIMNNNGPGIGGLDNLTTDQSQLTYSFNYGCDHYLIIDTDPVGHDARVPYKWIAGDLATARANNARHIFAMGHKPAWSSPLKPLDGLEAFVPERDSFWKYLEANAAVAMFAAHEHIWDTVHPHPGRTWQVIAGNGGSLVETTWMHSDQSYFGFTQVNLYKNNQINLKSYGHYADMANYTLPQDANPTTVRADFNIGIAPVFAHTPLGDATGHGPFTATATITGPVASAKLNYSVDGVAQASITPIVSGNTFSFIIPAPAALNGIIKYNIQATDTFGARFYSTGCASDYNQFTFCSPYATNINVTPAYPVAGQTLNTIYLGYGAQSVSLAASIPSGYPPYTFSWSPVSAATSSISVSPTTTTAYSVNVRDMYGCPSTAAKTVFVKDVQDPTHSNKIFVCHNGNSLSVSVNAIAAHLNHGDMLGNCSSTARMVVNEQNISVYPNPVNDKVTVNCSLVSEERVHISVIDLQGKQVLTPIEQTMAAGSHDVFINTAKLPNGTYILHVTCGQEESKLRILVQH